MTEEKRFVRLILHDDDQEDDVYIFYTFLSEDQIRDRAKEIMKRWRNDDDYEWEEAEKDILKIAPISAIEIEEVEMYQTE